MLPVRSREAAMRARAIFTAVLFTTGLFVVASEINAKAKLPDPWQAGQSRVDQVRTADWQRYHMLDSGPKGWSPLDRAPMR
jgi:mRNA-degrading endonuclease toxin of MazEF toxin-antitoxin module